MEINDDNKDKFGNSVLENTGAPIIVLDLQGRIVLLNPASERLSGYRFADLEGQYFREMLAATDDADSMGASEIPILVKEIERGAVRRTYCWQDEHGKNHFVEWVITPLYGNNGKVENIILTGLDETEHHRSEVALASSEEKYRNIVENSQEGIFTINVDNCVTFINSKMANMLGYSVEELLGQSVFNFLDKKSQEKIREAIERRKAGIKEQYALMIQHKNGTAVWAELNAAPLLNEEGAHVGSMATVTDITERRRTEEKLAQVQRMLEQANDVAKMGAWEFKPDSNVMVYSDVLKRILEVDPDYQAPPEADINFYKEGEDRDKIQRILASAIDKGDPWDEELRITTANGKEKWIRTIGHADFADNTCQRLYGSVQDITEQKRTEEKLTRLQRMLEQANEVAKMGAWEFKLDSNELIYSDGLNQILEVDPDYQPSLEKCINFFKEGDHRDKITSVVENAIGKGEPWDKEFIIVTAKGSEKWVRVIGDVEFVGNTCQRLYGSFQDITEQKRTEEKLAEVQRILEEANNISKLGAWEFKLGSKELIWSDMTKQIHEVNPDYKPDIETAINFYKEGESRDTISRVVEKAVEQGVPYDEELIIVTANGNEKWVRSIGQAEFVDDECVRLYGSFQDINARKVAEQEFERIFDLSLDIIGTGNMEGYFTRVNSSVKRLLGYDSEEFCSKPFLEFIHPEDVEKTLFELQAAQRGVKDIYVENRYICKDGSIKWIAWSVLAVAEENKFYATGKDYTERQQIENALRESELWMKNIFNSLEEAVLVVSPDRQLLNVNQAACNIFGYTREEIMSSSTELFHVDHQHYVEFGKRINKAFSKDTTANFEFVSKRKNGEIFPSEHTVSLLKDPEGRVIGIVSVVRDITERKNAQDELEKHRANLEEIVAERTLELRNAQEELVRKERLATLGQLTATVSHELRNPLGAMRPTIYLMKQYFGDNADEKLVKAIDRLDRNITRCDHIIDELLDFTRITDLEKKDTLIDRWLDSVIEENIDLENVDVQKNYSLADIEVPVDTNRLQRAIINVMENAYHAMHDSESGSNENAQARLTIDTRANGDRIEISISDTGPGIPEDILPRIFEPLFSTKNFGVGLGMSTVRQIMVQHGGGVDINTREGEGTTVTLWLPAKDSTE